MLDQILAAVPKAAFTISPKKREGALSFIKFLGYVISQEMPILHNVEAIKVFKVSFTLIETILFVGALFYHRPFLCDFSAVAKLLFRVTRKDVVFKWTLKQQDASDELNEDMVSALILNHFTTKEKLCPKPMRLRTKSVPYMNSKMLMAGMWFPTLPSVWMYIRRKTRFLKNSCLQMYLLVKKLDLVCLEKDLSLSQIVLLGSS